ncbi:hypothetical protein [Kitasatospora sp. NPDC054795]
MSSSLGARQGTAVADTGGIGTTGVFTDGLSDVLDGASVVPGSVTAGASIIGTVLTWSGRPGVPDGVFGAEGRTLIARRSRR